jgi:hypothetical protein
MEAQKSITISQLLQNLQEIYDQHGELSVYLSCATTGSELALEQLTVSPLDEEPEPLVVRLHSPAPAGDEGDDW